MELHPEIDEQVLREALEASGQRFTEQRVAVFRFLASTESHPSADEVFLAVRKKLPGISLATVYKSLETLVGCRLAVKLTYSDGSARYDGRTDPHHHARCVSCGRVADIRGSIPDRELASLRERAKGFTVTGYRLELSGYCADCTPADMVTA
ncbi:MAG TPA: transcriptional repressor [Longimicrobiales bacterium]|nr:transcriptional repressor [Longimicrobiales bacterium]